METDKRQILETDNEEIYFLSHRTETVKPNLPLFFDTHPFFPNGFKKPARKLKFKGRMVRKEGLKRFLQELVAYIILMLVI